MLLKDGMGIKYKFWYFEGSLKNPIFLGREVHERKQYMRGIALKKGLDSFTVCRFKSGIGKK